MNRYIKYLLYILEHKWNVGIECIKAGLFWHAITHDLSKFLPSEFFPYADWFFGRYGVKFKGFTQFELARHSYVKQAFYKAWRLHYSRNDHHWNYWIKSAGMGVEYGGLMHYKCVMKMICDWKGMSRKFGGTWKEYYNKNKDSMMLSERTIKMIEEL